MESSSVVESPAVKLLLGQIDPKIPTIDLISRRTQVFQGPLPSLNPFFVKTTKAADAILIPHDASDWDNKYRRYVLEVASERPIFAFNRSDSPVRIDIDNLYLLQTTIPAGTQSSRIIVIPCNIKSIWNGTLRKKTGRLPVISFAGFVPKLSIAHSVKTLIQNVKHPIKSNTPLVRKLGLKQIKNNFPSCRILERNHYGGAESLLINPLKFRAEFEESVRLSDLVFCPRGYGNNSQRFYEALSAGRIPLLPDTLTVFPKPNPQSINPSSVIVGCSALSQDLVLKVTNFWDGISNSEYVEFQRQNHIAFRENYDYGLFIKSLFSPDLNFSLDYFVQ